MNRSMCLSVSGICFVATCAGALLGKLDKTTATAVVGNLKTRVLLSLGYGCGLRASEIVRLKVKHIETEQKIIRIEQSKGRKDRYVKLPDEMRGLLRQWWKARPSRHHPGTPLHCRNVGCSPAESLQTDRSPLAISIVYSMKRQTLPGSRRA